MLVFPMWAGASIHFPEAPYTPETLVRTIVETGATICYTAPTFYRQAATFARELGVGKLRISVSAGEGLPDATRQLWKQATGIEVFLLRIDESLRELNSGLARRTQPRADRILERHHRLAEGDDVGVARVALNVAIQVVDRHAATFNGLQEDTAAIAKNAGDAAGRVVLARLGQNGVDRLGALVKNTAGVEQTD